MIPFKVFRCVVSPWRMWDISVMVGWETHLPWRGGEHRAAWRGRSVGRNSGRKPGVDGIGHG